MLVQDIEVNRFLNGGFLAVSTASTFCGLTMTDSGTLTISLCFSVISIPVFVFNAFVIEYIKNENLSVEVYSNNHDLVFAIAIAFSTIGFVFLLLSKSLFVSIVFLFGILLGLPVFKYLSALEKKNRELKKGSV